MGPGVCAGPAVLGRCARVVALPGRRLVGGAGPQLPGLCGMGAPGAPRPPTPGDATPVGGAGAAPAQGSRPSGHAPGGESAARRGSAGSPPCSPLGAASVRGCPRTPTLRPALRWLGSCRGWRSTARRRGSGGGERRHDCAQRVPTASPWTTTHGCRRADNRYCPMRGSWRRPARPASRWRWAGAAAMSVWLGHARPAWESLPSQRMVHTTPACENAFPVAPAAPAARQKPNPAQTLTSKMISLTSCSR